MKSIANYISIARIILVLTLLLIKPLSPLFFVVYILSGVSDILDGFIARKTNTTSKVGEKLDSIADFIMIMVLIVILYPFTKPNVQILLWIVIIGIIRAISVIIAFLKFKALGMIHTYANKVTGLILFLYPMLYVTFRSVWLMYGICIIASISALEELLINLTSNELNANIKSLFIK